MNIRWIPSPCKDCVPPKRQAQPNCHSYCPEFLEYQEKHYAEKDRMHNEDKVKKAVEHLNYLSGHKRDKNRGPLKHGYKPKRR